MAAAKPLIASDVDGNPYYVQDRVNGLIFRCGDPDDLAAKLRVILSSPELRRKFGGTGREIAMSKYVESSFGQQFAEMVRLTLAGR
jgi:glycosyltransferase involved in cell wall biosynthesis